MPERPKQFLYPSGGAHAWTGLWPHSCRWRLVGPQDHLLVLAMIFTLFVLPDCMARSCCADESRPTTDCSFAPHQPSKEHVACTLKDYRRHIEGCYHTYWTSNKDEIPAKVNDLQATYYYTQCERSLSEEPQQMSERCPSSCSANDESSYIAINITFKLDYTSASKLTAIEIKLSGLSGGFHGGKTWCVLYEYGKGNVTYDDAANHVFYYDGFVGLVPHYEYEVGVRGLPTARVDEKTWAKYRIKTRPCWTPIIRQHPSPAAINMSLIVDGEGYYKDMIDGYDVAVYLAGNNSLIRREQFPQSNQNRTSIVFDCLEPLDYSIEIIAQGNCESCLPYLHKFTVPGAKPGVSACPSNITIYTEVGGNVSVTWPTPTAFSMCPNLATIQSTQSHSSGDVFQEGTATEVRYEFWQYEIKDKATCSFYVHVMSDTDPPVVTCSNITLPPDNPNTFSGLVEGESFTYLDANPNPSGIAYNVTSGHLFPPGHTRVCLVATDTFGNRATCIFYVENMLSELPVNCPILDHSVRSNSQQRSYTFHPNIGEHNITKSLPGYLYYGGTISVNVTIRGLSGESRIPVGTHQVITNVSDGVLTKTCRGFYTVEELHGDGSSVQVDAIVGAVLGSVCGVLLIVCALFFMKSGKRNKCKQIVENCRKEKQGGNGYSKASPENAIDLAVLRNAPSEFSSSQCLDNQHYMQRVLYWKDDYDSGLQVYPYVDGESTNQLQMEHKCMIHADSEDNQPDSGVEVRDFQEHLPHSSQDEKTENTGLQEERFERGYLMDIPRRYSDCSQESLADSAVSGEMGLEHVEEGRSERELMIIPRRHSNFLREHLPHSSVNEETEQKDDKERRRQTEHLIVIPRRHSDVR